MTNDIVTRLRKEHAYSNDVGDFDIAKLVNEAADEIERLRKERDVWKHHANRLALWGAFSGNGLAAFHEWQQYDNAQRKENAGEA